MNILVISNLYPPDFIGGYELVCRQVVDALRARGHQVNVLTSAPRMPVPSVPHVLRRLRYTNVHDVAWMKQLPPVCRNLAYVESSFISAHNVHGLLAALQSLAPDVVYLHNLLGIGGLGLVACLHHLRVPWVWQLGDAVPRLLCMYGFEQVVPALVEEYNRQIRGR